MTLKETYEKETGLQASGKRGNINDHQYIEWLEGKLENRIVAYNTDQLDNIAKEHGFPITLLPVSEKEIAAILDKAVKEGLIAP
jgi:hypothetical protein